MTDFSKAYFEKAYKVELEEIRMPRCVLCCKTHRFMVVTRLVTSQDGIETSHLPNYVCVDCVALLHRTATKGKEFSYKNG